MKKKSAQTAASTASRSSIKKTDRARKAVVAGTPQPARGSATGSGRQLKETAGAGTTKAALQFAVDIIQTSNSTDKAASRLKVWIDKL